MSKFKAEVNTAKHEAIADEGDKSAPSKGKDELGSDAITVGAVVVGAALIEAALIPGIVIGAVAVMAPKIFPKLEKGVQPMLSSSIRGIYKLGRKAGNVFAEAKEHIGDITAEVKANEVAKAGEAATVVGADLH